MHRFTRSPVVRGVEEEVRAVVDKRGETFGCSVTPVYRTDDPTDVVPIGLTFEAPGDKGFSFTPHEGGSNTNIVTVPYVAKRV
ncbi:hypothetical protein ABT001_27020 [Streptomyces sp. NPDC002793]|uniref:hypothetical protein n=1 Tax=Streptomyces sp. NPDC002793 TaxID=3154432 RepID=UPI00331BB10D